MKWRASRAKAPGSIEVYRRDDGLWAWRLRAANSQIVATDGAQGYVNRYGAVRAANGVRKLMAQAATEIVHDA